jgi:hypothetical protein
MIRTIISFFIFLGIFSQSPHAMDEKTNQFHINSPKRKNESQNFIDVKDNDHKKACLKNLHSNLHLRNFSEKEGFLNSLPIEELPLEMIIQVAHYLTGKDFQNFAFTSKYINNILMNYRQFFIPEQESKIVKALNNTPINKIDLLAETWLRGGKRKVFEKLSKIAQANSSYVNNLGSTEYSAKHMLNQVELYIKSNRVMAYLGSLLAKEELEMAKDINMCNLWTRVNEEELGNDKEGARFSLIKTAMVSDKVEKIIPVSYMSSLAIDFEKEIEGYKPFGTWIPYTILLDDQIE